MRNYVLALAACACFAGSPVLAATQQPLAAAALRPVPENALRLARLVTPADKTVALGLKAFRAGVDVELKRSPENAALFDKNPGLLDAIVAAGQAVTQKHLQTVIPLRQQRIARFYADKFTSAEIDQLLAFYGSTTGAKFINAMYAGVSLDKVIEAMGPKLDKPLTAEAIENSKRAAAVNLPDQLEGDDWVVLLQFASSPIRDKLQRVAPEFHQLLADIENEPTPQLDADIEKAVEATVSDYMTKRKPKRD